MVKIQKKKLEISVSNEMFENKTATPIRLMLTKREGEREKERESQRKKHLNTKRKLKYYLWIISWNKKNQLYSDFLLMWCTESFFFSLCKCVCVNVYFFLMKNNFKIARSDGEVFRYYIYKDLILFTRYVYGWHFFSIPKKNRRAKQEMEIGKRQR